ncbi:helix-turn-helix transcriptional regulator [Bacillus sp. CRN 9]|nr:helix-turn-helix transcriptional regulator [Bacillus sp. CRN 9]
MNNEEEKLELVNQAIDDFGGLLQDYRRKYFLTLEDMASLVGCSASYIHRIEHGKRNPEIDFRIKVLTMGMNWSTEQVYLFLEEVISREQKRRAE